MADVRQPKGTLLTQRFEKNAPVRMLMHSEKYGYVKLLSAIVVDRETVLAFYGRIHAPR